MPHHPVLAVAGLTLLLAACASTPTRFHTLDPVPPAGAPEAAPIGLPVRLDSVILPAELDRPAIVRRTGPGRLDVADSDRWAGPLDEIARRALATDLAERMPAGSTVRPDDPAPPQKRRGLDVEIERFESDLAGQVTLIAHWTLLDGNTDRLARRRDERIEIPAGGADIDDAVTGMSRALGILADRIAAAAA